MTGWRILRALVYYELTRELRKKSFLVLVVLAVLPLIVAGILAATGIASGISSPRLWALILGLDTSMGAMGWISSVGLAGWAWLVSILYGGDLIASDIRDGVVHLVLSRPVRRSEYLAAKVATVALVILALFILAGVVALASAWVIAGPQEGVGEAIGFSALIGLSCIPLLLVAALVGAATRNSTYGMIAGFAAYMLLTIVPVMAGVLSMGAGDLHSFTAQKELMERLVYNYGLTPIVASFELPGLVYGYLHGDTIRSFIPLEVKPSHVLPLYVANTVATTLLLLLLLWVVFSRRDY